MELNSLLEIIVLIAIILEIYALFRHAQLEHKVNAHMELLDEHMMQLTKHIDQTKTNLDRTNKYLETKIKFEE